jgi:hypothetical protein
VIKEEEEEEEKEEKKEDKKEEKKENKYGICRKRIYIHIKIKEG